MPTPLSPADRHVPIQTVAVIAEEIDIDRERVETGAVRVRIESQERHESLQLDTACEWVEVERVAVDTPVPERQEPWQDGDVLVVPVYEERLVVQRQLVLKEELRLRKRYELRREEKEVPLRVEQARVERREGQGAWHLSEDDTARVEKPVSLSGNGESR